MKVRAAGAAGAASGRERASGHERASGQERGAATRAAPGRSGQGAGPALDAIHLWAAVCGAVTTLFAAILSTIVFGRIPHVQDSVAQLFQARIFAGGHLWVPSPPMRQAFDYAQMINDGRWYSQYPPGHALLLVPGVWLGIPWLVNPILAGVGVAATVLLARLLFGRDVARIAGVLGALSPFLVIMASEFMSHVSGFAVLTLFLLFVFRTIGVGDSGVAHPLRDGAVAGALLALGFLIRPYTAFAVALPVLAYTLWRLLRDRALVRPALLIAAGGAAGVILFGLYNLATTGSATLPGYVKLYGPSHGLGFGKGSWGPPHTLARGLRGTASTLAALNGRLFEWPVSSLWPAVLALLPLGLIGRRGAGEAGDLRASSGGTAATSSLGFRWLLASVPLCLLAAYVFYWYRDLCFGPRFVYEALAPLLILSACGLRTTGRALTRIVAPRARGPVRAAPGIVLGAALFAFALAVRIPALFGVPPEARGAAPATGPRMASYFQRFSPQFWGVSPQLGRLVRDQGLHHALVFTRFQEPEAGALPVRYLWFGSAFAHEEPDLGRADVVYARDLGPENARVAALFPDRRTYLYSGSIEGGTLAELPRTAPPSR